MGDDPMVHRCETRTLTQRKGRNAKGNAETQVGLHTVLNVKVLVGAFNKEKALVGAFSISAKSSGTFG